MELEHLIAIFHRCWSVKSSTKFHTSNPARGQCSVTALVVHNHYGGEILKTKTTDGYHFYNRINDQRYDLTASQFTSPLEYNDMESGWDEAIKDTSPDQYNHLEKAFLHYLQKEENKKE